MKPFPVVVRMENYTALLYKLSLNCWKKLPVSHKTWVSVDDLVQDGLLFARTKLMPKYDVRRAGFITILTTSLEQFYSRKLASLYRKKRMAPDLLVYLDALVINNGEFTTPQDLRSKDQDVLIQMSMEAAIDVLYKDASPLLRKYMNKWFYSEKDLPRVRNSTVFKRARREFRILAVKHNINAETFRVALENRNQKLSA